MPLSQITAYNVDFGECLLLKFIDENKESFLLLDCGSKTSPEKMKWSAIADDILSQMGDCKEISFMLSHLHTDHYNGFPCVYNILNGKGKKLKAFYSAACFNSDSNFSFVEPTFTQFIKNISSSSIPIISIGANQSVKQIDKSLNILWPPAPFSQNNLGQYFKKYVSEVDKYLVDFKKRYTNNDKLDYSSKFSEYDMNAMSIVFEVYGVNNQKYLFTGDLNNSIKLNSSNDFLKEFNIIDYSTKNIKGNYKMIKAPHHGTEDWILHRTNNFINVDYFLISWKKFGSWGIPNFSNFQKHISTNYPQNYDSKYLSAFKIQIDIKNNIDEVSVYNTIYYEF